MSRPRLHFHIVTLFPEACTSYLGTSIVGRAVREGNIAVSYYNPRDFTPDRWRRVDRRPYGGGPGMVLEPESVLQAAAKAIGRKNPRSVLVLFFEPGGTQFTTGLADAWATSYRHLVLICGRYEGIDARVKEVLHATTLSIGPYVLTGGELPAMVVLDCVTRRLPGVLGHEASVEERRIASGDVYTRPEVLRWKGTEYPVPAVLRSGNHKDIETWKRSHPPAR